MTTILWALSDLHSGHKLALMNPDTTLPEEDEDGNVTYTKRQLSSSQRYLWKRYMKGVRRVEKMSKGRDLIVILNGDLTSGNKHPSGNITTRISDQYRIAYFNLLPVMKIPVLSMVRIAVGTEAHNQGEGASELAIRDLLKAEFPSVDIKVVHHGLLDLGDGIDVDYAHHGPHPGSRKWLEGRSLLYYLQDFMTKEIMDGRVPARILLRAHYHAYRKVGWTVHTSDRDYTSTIILTPSWSMMNDFAYKATRSAHLITHGSVVVKIKGGGIDVKPLTKTIDLRTKERRKG